jgi:hypothetical protein
MHCLCDEKKNNITNASIKQILKNWDNDWNPEYFKPFRIDYNKKNLYLKVKQSINRHCFIRWHNFLTQIVINNIETRTKNT